jgi:hypothetical protein
LKLFGALFVAVLVFSAADVSAQPSTDSAQKRLAITTAGDLLHITAREFHFIHGAAMGRLKDGHPVRIEFELTALAKPDGSSLTRARQGFNLSYDLWEERFASTRIGSPPRSISHLTLADAEAWCLEHLTLPVKALQQMVASKPFWIRLEYRVQDPDDAATQDGDATLTLRRMIDVLSRRRKAGEVGDSVTAGPFLLSIH